MDNRPSNCNSEKELLSPAFAPIPSDAKVCLFNAIELLVILVFFFAAVIVLEIKAFNSPMIYDSLSWIDGKAHVFATRQLSAVAEIMPQRPLFVLSLYLNYIIGGMTPLYFRIFNALILAGTGVALMVMLNMIMALHPSGIRSAGSAGRLMLFLVGLMFVVHPLQVFTVIYIWQRETLLACLFYFSAMAVYAAGRSGALRSPVTSYSLTTLLFFLGLMSKENVITLPVTILLMEFVFFREPLKDFMKRVLATGIVALAPLLLYLCLSHYLHGPESVSVNVFHRLSQHYEESGIGLLNVLLTESRVWFLYLASIVFPSFSELQLVRAMEVSASLFDPPVTALACLGVVGLATLAFTVRTREPLISFGLLFFCTTLLPESLLIPQYLFFGYRAILPMAGLMLVLARVLILVSDIGRRKLSEVGASVPLAVLMCLAVAHLGMTTLQIASRWSPLWIWEHSFAAISRYSSRLEPTPCLDVMLNYGVELTRSGDFHGAVEVLQHAAAIPTPAEDHKKAQVLYNLGNALTILGNSEEATKRLNEAIQASPLYARPHISLGTLLLWAGDVPEALDRFKTAVRIDPSLPEAHYSLGRALLLSGDSAHAVASLQKALERKPNYPEASANLAKALLNLGRAREAVDQLKTAISAFPDSAELHGLLAEAYGKLGMVQEADWHLKRARDSQTGRRGIGQPPDWFSPAPSE